MDSLYGQVGCGCYAKNVAACTTEQSKAIIMQAKAFIELRYKPDVKCIYADTDSLFFTGIPRNGQ